eukprot:2792908-Pyramimonas_sp.AAC.1
MVIPTERAKGLTNQRSAVLSAVYLASVLGWDVTLPRVFSPLGCRDQVGALAPSRPTELNVLHK